MRILMLAPLQKENFEKIEMSFLEDEFIYGDGHTAVSYTHLIAIYETFVIKKYKIKNKVHMISTFFI